MAVLNLRTFGQVTCTGAAKALGLPSKKVLAIYIDALSGNAGDVFIGDSTVASGVGQRIAKGTALPIYSQDGRGGAALIALEQIYVFGAIGDKVSVNYLEVT